MRWWLLGIVFYGMAASIIFCLIIEARGEKPSAGSGSDKPIDTEDLTV